MIKLWLNQRSYFVNRLQDLLVSWMQSNKISFSFNEDLNNDSYHTYCFEDKMKTEQKLNCSLNKQLKLHDAILTHQSLD